MKDSEWEWNDKGRRGDHSKWTWLWKVQRTERCVTKASHKIITNKTTLIIVIKDPKEETLFQAYILSL